MGRPTHRAAAVLTAAVLACVPPATAAEPVPLDPNDPAIAHEWVNPQIRPDDGKQGLKLSLIDAPLSLPSGTPASITVRVRNDSEAEVSGLTIAPLRGPASGSVSDARAATVASVSEYSPIGSEEGHGKHRRSPSDHHFSAHARSESGRGAAGHRAVAHDSYRNRDGD